MGMDIDLFVIEPWHQPELTFRLLGFVLDPAFPLSLDAENKSPVSYTHLTLPTIYSV